MVSLPHSHYSKTVDGAQAFRTIAVETAVQIGTGQFSMKQERQYSRPDSREPLAFLDKHKLDNAAISRSKDSNSEQ